MDLGIVGGAGIDRVQSGLDPQGASTRSGSAETAASTRNPPNAVVEMGAAAMITHAVSDRAAVGDVQTSPAMAATQQTGQQRIAATHGAARHQPLLLLALSAIRRWFLSNSSHELSW